MPAAAIPFPPGDLRRESLGLQLRNLDTTTVRIAFEARQAAYYLLSYRLGTAWTPAATAKLRELVLGQIRCSLPRRSTHEGKRGRLDADPKWARAASQRVYSAAER